MATLQQDRFLRFSEGGIRIYEITINERPPYSNRTPPVVVECAFRYPGDAVWCDFGDFRVEYEGGIFVLSADVEWTAEAKDSDGRHLAVAEAISLKEGVGVEFRETHFASDGKVRFSAKVFFGFDGIKRQESETIGTKERDYFYYWPPPNMNFMSHGFR